MFDKQLPTFYVIVAFMLCFILCIAQAALKFAFGSLALRFANKRPLLILFKFPSYAELRVTLI